VIKETASACGFVRKNHLLQILLSASKIFPIKVVHRGRPEKESISRGKLGGILGSDSLFDDPVEFFDLVDTHLVDTTIIHTSLNIIHKPFVDLVSFAPVPTRESFVLIFFEKILDGKFFSKSFVHVHV
jgi:hypothetical protein